MERSATQVDVIMATDLSSILDRRKYIVFDDPSFLGAETDLTDSIISAKFSSGIDLSTQVTLEIIDPGFGFAKNNYFAITRDVYIQTNVLQEIDASLKISSQIGLQSLKYQRLEISAVTCKPGPGSSPVWTVECRTKAVQQMRRDRRPGAIEGASQNYVISAGQAYNIGVVAEQTSKSKKINKASNDRRSDSLWDVITSLAGEAKFVAFETDGILFFASQKWLLGQWGSIYSSSIPNEVVLASSGKLKNGYNFIPVRYPSEPTDVIQVHNLPQCRRSDNNPLMVEGTMTVDYVTGSILRPGMTIMLVGYPTFEGMYPISAVDYDILSGGPATISFRSPEREEKDVLDYQIGERYDSFFWARWF